MFAFAAVALGFAGLTGRLFFLQGLHGKEIRTAAIKSRLEVVPVKARRGSILSVEGYPLAISKYRGILGFDPTRFDSSITDPAKKNAQETEIHESVMRVAKIISVDPSTIEASVIAARTRNEYLKRTFSPEKLKGVNMRFYPIKEDLDLVTSLAVRSAMNPTRRHDREAYQKPLVGFGINDSSFRSYDQGDAGLQVVGYIDKAENPRSFTGLELSHDSKLKQTPGTLTGERDKLGRIIPETETQITPAINGLDIHTTIDTQVQNTAAAQAKLILQKYHPRGVSIIVMDPTSGDIWTMLSYPSISLPDLRKTKLRKEALAPFLTERCYSQLYEPGSTMKTLTIALALENQTINRNSYFQCGGRLSIGKHAIQDSHHEAHGWLSLNEILAKSCNVCTAQIGLQMKPKSLTTGIRTLGLLSKPDLGMKYEKGGNLVTDYERIKYGRENESRDNIARIAFGQSITTTPLNLIRAYCALANGGRLVKPRLITSYSLDDKVVQSFESKDEGVVFSPETCAFIREALIGVVSKGTGKVAAIEGFTVAGKTGTAQKLKQRQYVGSFIGFLPANKPRAVVLVVVDEPQGAFYGADVAGPAFKAIGQAIMTQKNVKQDDPEMVQYYMAHPGAKPVTTSHFTTSR